MVKEKEDKNKSDQEEVKVVDVATQTERAFQLLDGSIISSDELLVKIYNDLHKILKAVV
jgi:outer membrane receptor for ferrienterochelin and colicin